MGHVNTGCDLEHVRFSYARISGKRLHRKTLHVVHTGDRNLGTVLAIYRGGSSADSSTARCVDWELDMTGLVESQSSTKYRELDETIERLAPVVEELLQRFGPAERLHSEAYGSGIMITMPIRFPDGIGQGDVVARLFRYRDAVRLDIEIEHNRVFTKPDGSASERRCFFNDFVASVRLDSGTDEVPNAFRRRVIAGVSAAKDAVQRYNRTHPEPWNEVKVVAAR